MALQSPVRITTSASAASPQPHLLNMLHGKAPTNPFDGNLASIHSPKGKSTCEGKECMESGGMHVDVGVDTHYGMGLELDDNCKSSEDSDSGSDCEAFGMHPDDVQELLIGGPSLSNNPRDTGSPASVHAIAMMMRMQKQKEREEANQEIQRQNPIMMTDALARASRLDNVSLGSHGMAGNSLSNLSDLEAAGQEGHAINSNKVMGTGAARLRRYVVVVLLMVVCLALIVTFSPYFKFN